MSSNTDKILAFLSARGIEEASSELDALPTTVKERDRRGIIMRAWSHVQGTNAWKYGEGAFEPALLRAEDVDAHAWWCWYTTLAVELSSRVRLVAAEFGVKLPVTT